jgi:hypothetical protein
VLVSKNRDEPLEHCDLGLLGIQGFERLRMSFQNLAAQADHSMFYALDIRRCYLLPHPNNPRFAISRAIGLSIATANKRIGKRGAHQAISRLRHVSSAIASRSRFADLNLPASRLRLEGLKLFGKLFVLLGFFE